MGKDTSIAWTDHTFNPWWGCTKVSPGCDHCYAESFDKRVGGEHWGKGAPRREFGDKHWNEPLKWDAAAAKAGVRSKVFCASMADVMDDEAPAGARERLWALIDTTPNLIWQLLTKRPQRYERYLPASFKHRNVWLGTTTENQENFDLRWPILSAIAEHRNLISWISYEPALGALTLRNDFSSYPNWIIFGGESGGKRRACNEQWARNLLGECDELDISFFMKQMSAQTPAKAAALIPVELLVRDFPNFPQSVQNQPAATGVSDARDPDSV